jgi:riboflavin transporter FmnP
MDTKKISLLIVFAALTIVLNLSPLKFPAPYAPFLIYQVWEIPIVTAFLLYGTYFGVITAIINTLLLLVIFPGALPTGPIYNLAAVLSTLLGIYVVMKVLKDLLKIQSQTIIVSLSTGLGMVMRVIIMSIINWVFIPYPPPIGFGMPLQAVIALLPVVAFFNATLALYTIPISYFLANTVRERLNV